MSAHRMIALFVLLSLILSAGCKKNQPVDVIYIQSIDEWHTKRIDRLKAPDGWLSLAGLFWLESGKNTFGAGAENSIIFPPAQVTDQMGVFILEDTLVTMILNPGSEAYAGDTRITENSPLTLRSDASGKETIIQSGSLSWYVIQRDGRYGIRLKDSAHKSLEAFHGIDRFPVDIKWRVKAELVRHDSLETYPYQMCWVTHPCSQAPAT